MHLPTRLRNHQHKLAQSLGLRPPPAWPLLPDCTPPTIHDQHQSYLFKLSAELRNSIYFAVLADEERFLHICMNSARQKKGEQSTRQIAHWRCTDPDSEYWTFQHRCYGEEPWDNDGRRCNVTFRRTTETQDGMMGLLVSCRRVYSETLAILYESNFFHFRGGMSLPAFKRAVPLAQWNAIRRIHVSTAYSPFYWPNSMSRIKGEPPRTLPNWELICNDLCNMPNLQVLSFDILSDEERFRPVEGSERLLRTLGPLTRIRAESIEVEMNEEVDEEVRRALGPVNFTVVFREREFNEGFRDSPMATDCMRLKERRQKRCTKGAIFR